MSRPSFRPRPLDIHKKLPIIKSAWEFEDDETPRTTTPYVRHIPEPEVEAPPAPSKKNSQEIPTPQYNVVDTYERDYTRTFVQPASFIRGRGARAEIGEFVEYDLDNEDEDWLEKFNERKNLSPEKFEIILFKLEILDHKARERAGLITPTSGAPIPVILQLDSVFEALQTLSIRSGVIQAVYYYWKSKRERWTKPVLRCLQPPPPVNDTNPYNVFRPREKTPRLHTRRMQRRENNVQSFEKLRLVRRNLDQVKALLDALIKREEKKREVMECEVNIQRIRMKYKNEAQLVEDTPALSGFQQVSSKFGSSDDEYADSDETATGRAYFRPSTVHQWLPNNVPTVPPLRIRRQRRLPPLQNGWSYRRDTEEPVLLFTRPLDSEKLAAAGIKVPPDPAIKNGTIPPYRFRGRIGRGGRIIFDRCNPLHDSSHFVPYDSGPSLPEG